jgi:hypothetical protein
MGSSDIEVTTLTASDPKVVEICKMHDIDPALAAGGAFVTWDGAMAWDKDDENHKGSTVFAIVPDADNPRKGRMLRERGYAEIVPVVGRFEMDDEDALILITEYETMSTIERFWFPNPNLRMRTSAVKRFGGFNTSTFCTEVRVEQTTRRVKKKELPKLGQMGFIPVLVGNRLRRSCRQEARGKRQKLRSLKEKSTKKDFFLTFARVLISRVCQETRFFEKTGFLRCRDN